MPRLVLIDHSLKRRDGHHFDYARHVLAAAEQAGWTTVLATHRRLADVAGELRVGAHLPLLGGSTYSRFTLARASQRPLSAAGDAHPATRETAITPVPTSWQAAWERRRFLRGRQRHILRLARDCQRLFIRIGHQPEDHVFFPTVSELDVLGLARFLADRAIPQKHWHVQFHNELVEDDAGDERARLACVQWIRKQLHEALGQVGDQRLHFYCTTEPLQRQYRQLAIGDVQLLPYPINPALHAGPTLSRPTGPIRIVCPGGPRKEKGLDDVKEIAAGMIREVPDGSICFLVQSRRKNRWRDWITARWGEAAKRSRTLGPGVWRELPHPLSATDYVQLVRSADIGLLLYDRKRYAARRAGVLGEFLAAGVPVVVPSACWLADQIAEASHAYAEEQLAESMAALPGTWQAGEQRWEASPERPDDCQEVVISWRSHAPDEPAVSASVSLYQFDAAGRLTTSSHGEHGACPRGEWSHVLVRLAPQATRLRCECRLPGALRPAMQPLRLAFLRPSRLPQGRPLGAVGRAVDSLDETRAAIQEILRHLEHYRQTAQQFSVDWFRRHDPRATLDALASASALPESRLTAAIPAAAMAEPDPGR